MLYETKLLQNINVCVSLPDLVWGVLINDKFKVLDRVKRFSIMLPLLENDKKKIDARISEICSELGMPTIRFPYDFLLIHALKYPTSYWPNLAVRWLDEGSIENSEILDCLVEIENNKNHEQKLRQRCKYLIESKAVRSAL